MYLNINLLCLGNHFSSFLYAYDIDFIYVETEQGVAQAIIRSVVEFKRDPWPKVSDNAKDLVKKMLDPDPKKRLTAQGVLGKVLSHDNRNED